MSDVEHKGMLRQRLKDADPVLSAHLERSWGIAFEWWLHAVPVQLGSANSAPHLRNVERHLDEIIKAFEELPGTTYIDRLTPAETYVLLSAVLFHDVGRTQPEKHGEEGQRLLHDRYAHFGISSVELANVLGSICEFHSRPQSDKLHELAVTSIEPYGRIRIPFIASLLLLADSMDAGYTRALPDFLVLDHDKRGIVGRFRRGIRGVYIDAGARMVRTVLATERTADQRANGEEPQEDEKSKYTIGAPDKWLCDWNISKDRENGIARSLSKWLPEESFQKLLSNIRKKSASEIKSRTGIWPYLDKRMDQLADALYWPLMEHVPPDTEKALIILLSLGLVQLKQVESEDKKTPEGRGYPVRGDLAIVIGDTYANRHVLGMIKNTLAAEGIVLSSWVIERDLRIYNALGELTYEPILTLAFLRRTIKGMWALSTSIFGTSSFSYRDLAACIGEPDERRVEYAVRRIAATVSTTKNNWVAAGGDSWEWCVSPRSDNEAACVLTGVIDLWKEVEKVLHEPNEEFDQWHAWHKRMKEVSNAC